MIDTTALTALITAFRAEVTQNSISPEKVGSILQQIADLLATAAPDSDMSEFTVLRRVKINFPSRLLAALTTLRVLESAHARQSKNKFFLCSRLLADLVNIVKKMALPDIWNLDFVYIRSVK